MYVASYAGVVDFLPGRRDRVHVGRSPLHFVCDWNRSVNIYDRRLQIDEFCFIEEKDIKIASTSEEREELVLSTFATLCATKNTSQ